MCRGRGRCRVPGAAGSAFAALSPSGASSAKPSRNRVFSQHSRVAIFVERCASESRGTAGPFREGTGWVSPIPETWDWVVRDAVWSERVSPCYFLNNREEKRHGGGAARGVCEWFQELAPKRQPNISQIKGDRKRVVWGKSVSES